MVSIYDYDSYKVYLQDWMANQPGQGRGLKAKLALAIRTQAGFVTQILSGGAHFSLEQGLGASQMIGHSTDEQSFFILLIQMERAGTQELQAFFFDQIQTIRKKRLEISERLKMQSLPTEVDESEYFRTWVPACVHVMILAQKWVTKEDIAHYLGIPTFKVAEALEFLLKSGLITFDGAKYKTGPVSIHLGKSSPHLLRHHLNWNFKALQALECDHKKDLHYSSVMSVSAKDAEQIRNILISSVKSANEVAVASDADKVYATTINFFELKSEN